MCTVCGSAKPGGQNTLASPQASCVSEVEPSGQ